MIIKTELRNLQQVREFHKEGKLCLFVGAGVSMDCGLPDYIRRLLDICKKVQPPYKHFALIREPVYKSGKKGHANKKWWGKLVSNFMKEVEEKALIDRGITPIWFKDYSDIPNYLEELK